MAVLVAQRSFDELGTPLHAVTFVVLDLETTGTSPSGNAITEVGAVRYRGGERLGVFHTLVNPGCPIPPMITVLTGITEAMVAPAPRIAAVLPDLLEFVGGAVIVGHNVRFDLSFLDAALDAHGYPHLANTRLDTLRLSRRLVRDEVPDLRLATLSRHFRTSVAPEHRALGDAQATAEVFHALLERAGTLGVTGLDDLLELPTVAGHPSARKLRLASRLPRTPGVYLFRDRGERVLYVGKATNLRARVRSYFSSDDRRKVPQLLREAERIDHLECATPLEAAVRELRLIQHHQPRFNRRAKAWRRYAYLKLTLPERFPRLAVVRDPRDDGALYLGPLRSASAAHALREAIESAVPLRRCNRRVGHRRLPCDAPCVPAQLGVAACPCSGHTPADDYAALVELTAGALLGDPAPLLEPLARRMDDLAGAERFEEAALARDRLALLVRALDRQRRLEALLRAGQVRLESPHGPVELSAGRLVLPDAPEPPPASVAGADDVVARDAVDELLVVARWLDEAGPALRVTRAEGPLASILPALPVLPRYDRPRRLGARR